MYIFLNSQVYAIYVTPYFVHVCICTHVCVHICCAHYSMYECTPFAQADCMTHVYIISILMYNISVYTCISVQSSKYYHYILSLLYTAIYNDTSIMSSVLLPLVVVVAVLCSMVVFDPIAFSCTWLLWPPSFPLGITIVHLFKALSFVAKTLIENMTVGSISLISEVPAWRSALPSTPTSAKIHQRIHRTTTSSLKCLLVKRKIQKSFHNMRL